jgi:hypothetical protein
LRKAVAGSLPEAYIGDQQEVPMKLSISHQDRYSRGELILRTLFGYFYIGIPHGFMLGIVGIWYAIIEFVKFWVVLFTGRFPESMFNFQLGYLNWSQRVNATLSNLVDGYPAFFPRGTSDRVKLEVTRPEKVRQGLVLVRLLFGWIYVGIPHGICLIGRFIATAVLMFLAWWAVLFTGRYPERWHAFNVGTYRWAIRITLYLSYFTDTYPPFSGKE